MRALLVLDHPYEGSFTYALADAAGRGLRKAGVTVEVIDLHADGFDPVMHSTDLLAWRSGEVVDPQVAKYQQRIADTDYLIFAFPIWWEVMPAMTKGFIDKVVTKGFAYEQPKPGGMMHGRLTGLQGVYVLTSMATTGVVYRVIFGKPLINAMFRGTFHKIGVHHLHWLNHSNPAGKSPEQRRAMLRRVEARFASVHANSDRRHRVVA